MIYFSQKQLPEFSRVAPPMRHSVWISFVCARPLAPIWHSRLLGAFIIAAAIIGFSVGLFVFSSPSFLVTLLCGVAGILVGFIPLVVMHLYFINSRSVRDDLKTFVSHLPHSNEVA
jgi:hypothetical protein